MALWVDKYRPRQLSKLTYHHDLTDMLSRMVETGELPHLLFYGPSGAGKKTRILSLLRSFYGPGVERVKFEHRTFKVRSKNVQLVTLGSNYHIEMNPGDAGIYDRQVVQDIIKEIASSHTLDAQHQKQFKVVILNEVDKLSKSAQHALRRTMEKYMATCRIILCCESANKVIEPLQSRCFLVRVPAPTHDQILESLKYVAKKENLKVPEKLARNICLLSKRNLRRAILMLEACKVKKYPFDEEQKVGMAEWETFIDSLARIICEEQSPRRLLVARGKIYELLTHCIPPGVVIETLARCLIRKVDTRLKPEIVKWAAFYDHRMQIGTKPVFHLEAFVAKFMSIYKRWCIEMFG